VTYIRLSIVRPRRGEEKRVEDLMRKLAAAVSETDGCLQSYVLRPDDESSEVARIAIYTDETAGEKAANSQHIMSLRSELHLCSEAGHVERAFFSI
jgi:quinol monooxygenase YgiN